MEQSLKKKSRSKDAQIQELRERLAEAEANLDAIRSGKADAIVVQTETGISVFTIQGAEAAYRIMVETMNEGAITIDPEGIILYANTRFCALLSVPCPALVGKHLQNFVADEYKAAFDLFLKKTGAGNSVHQDFELVKQNLTTIPVYCSSAPLEIMGRHDMCIVVSDLTERVTAQQKLMELNTSLERKVRDRTRQLEEQKTELEKSREELQRLTASLEQQVERRTMQVRDLAKALTLAEQRQRQHLSVILHEDLQQVLFSAKARFSLLRDTVHTGEPGEVETDLRDLEALIIKALETSRRLAIEFNPPVLSSEGLDAALKWLAHHIQNQYGLKVEVCISEGFRVIRDDERVLLVQLVRELLLNIVKHARTSTAFLSVTRDQKHIFIQVEDQGVGFNPGEEKLPGRERTHFGLFSIEERLALFGGDLHIESQPGKGTRIRMTLPFDPKVEQLSVE